MKGHRRVFVAVWIAVFLVSAPVKMTLARWHVGTLQVTGYRRHIGVFTLQPYSPADASADSLKGMLKEGKVWLSRGDIKRARNVYAMTTAWAAGDSGVAEEAMFRMAEIDYMTGEIDSALTRLNTLVGRFPKGGFVNDALEMVIFLEEGSRLAEGDLKIIGQAELDGLQGKVDTALARLDTLASHSLLADRALFVKSQIEHEAGCYHASIATLESLIAAHRESHLLPEAKQRIAEIYEINLGAIDKAIKVYEEMVIGSPQSLYADEARIRMHELKRKMKGKEGI